MNSTITSVALLIAAAAATATESQFLQYEGQFNKAYRTVSEQQEALRNYQNTDARLNAINAEAAENPNPNAARVGHNFLSDMSVQQRANYLGRNTPADYVNDEQPVRGGRGLQNTTPVDHAVDGWVHPVKDQGGCGSCYTFGANTAMEAQIMKIKGENNTDGHFRLSEQEGVECTDAYGNGGCQGGLEYYVWNYIRDQGILQDSEYPYTGRDQACQRSSLNGTPKKYGVTGWTRSAKDVASMKVAVQDKAVAIGIYASCDAFMFYQSGIILQSQCNVSNMDHSVTLVGWYDGDSDPSPSPTPDPEPSPSPEPTPDNPDHCIVTKWYSRCFTVQSDADGRSSVGNNMPYWRIQNSWGTGWGQGGFAKLEMAEGNGVGCTNCDVTWPNLDVSQIDA